MSGEYFLQKHFSDITIQVMQYENFSDIQETFSDDHLVLNINANLVSENRLYRNSLSFSGDWKSTSIPAHKIILAKISHKMSLLMSNKNTINLKNFGITYNPLVALLAIVYKSPNRIPLDRLSEKEIEELWNFLIFLEITPNKLTNRIMYRLLMVSNRENLHSKQFLNNIYKLQYLGWSF